jgi:hypothetical protein
MEDKQNKQRKSKKFLIILGVLIICLIGFLIYKSNKKNELTTTTTTTKIQGYKICSKSITDDNKNKYTFTLYQNNMTALVNITDNHNETVYYTKLENYLLNKKKTSTLCGSMNPSIIDIKSSEKNYNYIIIKYTKDYGYEYDIASINNNIYTNVISLASLTTTTYKSGTKTLPLFTLGTNKVTTFSNGCFDLMNINTKIETGEIPKYEIQLAKGKYTFKQIGNESLTTSGIVCW